MTRTEWNIYLRKDWIHSLKRQVIEKYNKLLKGNISVSQAHAERDEIAELFDQLGDDLEQLVKERDQALTKLVETQKELKKYKNN